MTAAPSRLASALSDRYRVEHELGRGGMATVYLAHDLKHDRDVAIKVLHEDLGATLGPERFLAEIKTTAKLQHPHILPLLDSGDAGGLLFYVMPYVAGETLRDRLARETQLPLEDAVRIAREVADALGFAHGHGIIHRDIKPENILLQGGHALVADFGIALAVQHAGGARLTQTGLSLGTPQYMAPEQAMSEKTVDHHADIYALGAVTYEMLTGEPPFTGANVQAIVAKVLSSEPAPLTTTRKMVPPHIEAAVLKALAKLPADRWAEATGFSAALVASGANDVVTRRPLLRTPRTQTGWAMAMVAGVGLVAFGAWIAMRWLSPGRGAPRPLAHFTVTAGPVGEPWPNAPIALAPDGSALVYTGFNARRIWQLFVRRLGSDGVEPIEGTEDASMPFISPSGLWVGFYQNGDLKKAPLTGGRVSTLCNVEAPQGHLMFGPLADASWGVNDTIVFIQDGKLYSIAASGGRRSLLASPDSAAGELQFTAARFIGDTRTLFVSALRRDGATVLGTLPMDTRRFASLDVAGTSPRYVDGGYLMYADADGAIVAAPFDAQKRRIRGPPFSVSAVLSGNPIAGATGRKAQPSFLYDVSRSGLLVFGTRRRVDREVLLVRRDGAVSVLPVAPASWSVPRFSPDGRRVVLQRGADEFGGTLSIYDVASQRTTPLLLDSSAFRPEWSADGRHIVYYARNERGRGLFRLSVDGGGSPQLVHPSTESIYLKQITPDGQRFVHECRLKAGRDLCVTTMGSTAPPTPLVATEADEMNAALSPDGTWLAFVSSANGQNEVYLRHFSAEGPSWPVSRHGGTEPRWADNGHALVYRSADTVYSVNLSLASEPRIGAPQIRFFGSLTPANTYSADFDVSPSDGALILLRPVGMAAPLEYHFVLNWLERLRSTRSER